VSYAGYKPEAARINSNVSRNRDGWLEYPVWSPDTVIVADIVHAFSSYFISYF
jgi:hypothetical protein